MAASMPCKDCASGVLHEGTPAGREETIHGLMTYVTDPPSGVAAKGIVVIIPDLFGWSLNNSRVLADRYAERGGYTVYLPDFMDGTEPNNSVACGEVGRANYRVRIRTGPQSPLNPRHRHRRQDTYPPQDLPGTQGHDTVRIFGAQSSPFDPQIESRGLLLDLKVSLE